MPLEFSELFHKSALTQTNKDRFKVPGVYIWGFVYHKTENGIGDPVDFTGVKNLVADPDEHVFIPYYVGKHERSVLDRLREHQDVRNGNALRLTRFTLEYMKCFFKDTFFKLNTSTFNDRNFINLIANYQYTSAVEYYNDSKILFQLHGNAINIVGNKPKNFPINQQSYKNGQAIFDTLDFLSKTFNNFFFTFVDLRNLKHHEDMNLSQTIELIESITAMLLKGKTVAKIEKLNKALISIGNNDYNLNGPQGFDIFKDRDDILIDKTGKYQINNIAFPGYLQTPALQ